METNAERRRKKLEALCNERGLKAVAEAAGLNWQYIDQAIKKTLLPAKKDGTRGYRKMSDEAFEKIEKAFKLGSGWFDEVGPQVPNTTPKPSTTTPTLAETLAQLGEHSIDHLLEILLAKAAQIDAGTRDTLATLIAQAVRDPANAGGAMAAMNALLRFSTAQVETASYLPSTVQPDQK